jgi:hypothetical protein
MRKGVQRAGESVDSKVISHQECAHLRPSELVDALWRGLLMEGLEKMARQDQNAGPARYSTVFVLWSGRAPMCSSCF